MDPAARLPVPEPPGRIARLRPATCALRLLATCLAGVPARAANERANSDIVPDLRPVRVLMVSGATRLRLSSPDPVLVGEKDGTPLHRLSAGTDMLLVAQADGSAHAEGRSFPSDFLVSPEGEGPVRLSAEKDGEWSLPVQLTGWLEVRTAGDGCFSVINHVEVEQYVSGVVAAEVWPTFHQEAFRAQSVVSRTYVLHQMMRRPDPDFDLVASQAAQVYGGSRDNETGRRAKAAARYTRGIVLTYRDEGGRDRLFCTYYSAACGGCSQPAEFLGPEGNVPPLRGGVPCDFCKIAPGETYRWGPVSLPVSDVLARLSARFPEAASLPTIGSIEPIERTKEGRPVSLSVAGGGKSVDFLAERFRLALDGALVRSTDCRIRVVDGEVIFDEGKGFGHGLGLCQWGMQGQALAGRRAGEILTFYFPGAKLTRVY